MRLGPVSSFVDYVILVLELAWEVHSGDICYQTYEMHVILFPVQELKIVFSEKQQETLGAGTQLPSSVHPSKHALISVHFKHCV